MSDSAFTDIAMMIDILAAERICLRRLRLTDAVALWDYRRRPDVARYQGFEPYDCAAAEALVREMEHQPFGVPGQWLQLGIARSESDTLIGDCGVRLRTDEPQLAEIGFTLSPGFQGRGYATEAVRRLVDFLFAETAVRRIVATTDADNSPSARLLRRAGFRQEGHFIENTFFKGAWGSEFQFAQLRREWEARAAAPGPA